MIAVIAPIAPGRSVRVNGRDLPRDRRGTSGTRPASRVVNRLPLESYLLGVVSAEMGRRKSGGVRGAQGAGGRLAHLRAAQSRPTAALGLRSPRQRRRPGVRRRAGRRRPKGLEAVLCHPRHGADLRRVRRSTPSTIRPAAGRPPTGSRRSGAAARPYLRSFARRGRERRGLLPHLAALSLAGGVDRRRRSGPRCGARCPRPTGVPARRVAGPGRAGWCSAPTPAGSAAWGSRSGTNQVMVDGPVDPAGAPSPVRRSAPQCRLRRSPRRGDRQQRSPDLVAEGRGAGHGVGLCQWGAVGRSRAGQDFQRILGGVLSGHHARAASTEEDRHDRQPVRQRATQGRDHRRRARSPRSPTCRCSRSSRPSRCRPSATPICRRPARWPTGSRSRTRSTTSRTCCASSRSTPS